MVFRLTPCFLGFGGTFFPTQETSKTSNLPVLELIFVGAEMCCGPVVPGDALEKIQPFKSAMHLGSKETWVLKKNGKTGPMILDSGFCFGDMLAYQRKCS